MQCWLIKMYWENADRQSVTQVWQLYVHASVWLKVMTSWLDLPSCIRLYLFRIVVVIIVYTGFKMVHKAATKRNTLLIVPLLLWGIQNCHSKSAGIYLLWISTKIIISLRYWAIIGINSNLAVELSPIHYPWHHDTIHPPPILGINRYYWGQCE